MKNHIPWNKGLRGINTGEKHWTARNGGKRPEITGPNHYSWHKKRPEISGEKNIMWKGNNVSYGGLHHWVRNHLGKPKKCEDCGTITASKYEWANKSGEYKRDLGDWKRLCTSCHHKYDQIWLTRNRDIKGRFI